MSQALITGATGFVGSNLARRLLAQGWGVRCFLRAESRVEALADLPVERVTGSFEDPESLSAAARDVDVVFHLAGRVAAYRAEDFLRDNVEVTRAVARACGAQPRPPVLVFVSSLAAGGPATLKQPRRECDAERPVSAYGRSKLAAEAAAIDAAGDAPLSIMRPPMVFGQGDRASLQIFRSMKFLPMHLVPGIRRFVLSVVHVADLCDALLLVAERGERVTSGSDQPPGVGRYHVTTDRPVSYGQIGQLAAHAAGWAVGTLPTPRTIFWAAGALGELVGRIRKRPTILNFDKVRETMASGWVCSDAKLREELGYQSRESLETRFAETVAWYREHGWL